MLAIFEVQAQNLLALKLQWVSTSWLMFHVRLWVPGMVALLPLCTTLACPHTALLTLKAESKPVPLQKKNKNNKINTQKNKKNK